MTSKNSSKKRVTNKPVGVIGAGSFGCTVANLLIENSDVILYARNSERAEEIRRTGKGGKYNLDPRVKITSDPAEIGHSCDVIFPIVPAEHFRQMMGELSPHLKPYHILIHGTKGLDFFKPQGTIRDLDTSLTREYVKTMSEVIFEESSVVRVGCMAGPNLARELAMKLPAATVIASHFDEVINVGQNLLKNDRFLVYGSKDLIGVELCGILKNILAIGAGMIQGKEFGENARSLLISRGMVEMIHIGKALGGNVNAFLGLAGVGDLIATCSSPYSRNFSVGYRLGKGEDIGQITDSMEEVAEGLHTINIIRDLAKTYNIKTPITESIFNIIHGNKSVDEVIRFFMRFPFTEEIDFI